MNDPLFDPGYMRTHGVPAYRDFYAGGIATDELPKAGPPWECFKVTLDNDEQPKSQVKP